MSKFSFKPTEIIFGATDACNLHCPHCYVSRSPNKLSTETAKTFIKSAVSSSLNPNYIKKIGFSGGEPFLYQEFLLEIIKFTVENDLMFDQIMTNGDWWKDEAELELKLQQLYDAGFDGKIGLSWDIFHNQSAERMDTFISTVERIFGAYSLVIQSVIPADKICSAYPSAKEIQNMYPEITVYPMEQSFPGNDPKSWRMKKWFKDDFCQGPGNILYIHPDGNIAPCCGFANENPKLFIGTINDTFDEVIKKAEANPMIHLCYTEGLLKARKLLKKQKIKMPGKCHDICSFCDFVCNNLK